MNSHVKTSEPADATFRYGIELSLIFVGSWLIPAPPRWKTAPPTNPPDGSETDDSAKLR